MKRLLKHKFLITSYSDYDIFKVILEKANSTYNSYQLATKTCKIFVYETTNKDVYVRFNKLN